MPTEQMKGKHMASSFYRLTEHSGLQNITEHGALPQLLQVLLAH